MLLTLHIIIALLSMLVTTVLFFAPTSRRFDLAKGMVVATIASGSSLIIFAQASMLRTCLSGLFYIGAISYTIMIAQRRFADQKTVD